MPLHGPFQLLVSNKKTTFFLENKFLNKIYFLLLDVATDRMTKKFTGKTYSVQQIISCFQLKKHDGCSEATVETAWNRIGSGKG